MRTFLRAEWRKLILANFAVDKELLAPYLPRHTEIDLHNDVCYLSLVGFMFLNTRIKGLRIPFHTNFEEVNLRFYVRYNDAGSWKRGVVFIKEIVPRRALTFVANTVYSEKYATCPMTHAWRHSRDDLHVEYRWKGSRWNMIQVIAAPDAIAIQPESTEEFLTEHYWGYTSVAGRHTSEYGVLHPRWEYYSTREYTLDVDYEDVYGEPFAFLKDEVPVSVFIAEGSEVSVLHGRRI